MAIIKAKAMTLPKAKTAKITNPAAAQIKNTGLSGYLQQSKMKPLVKTIKAQLNS